MKIKLLFPILAVIGVILTIIYINSGDAPPPKQVPLAQPSTVPFEKYIGGSGITEPNTEVISIGSNKPGIIKAVNATIGQSVVKDDILFVIENSEAEADVKQAQAELNNAQQQFNVVKAIGDKRAISKDERNARKNNLDQAKALFEKTRATLELHNVRAPVDAIVLSSDVRVGEFAPAGIVSEPLIRLGSINPMNVRVDIDENDAWRFKKEGKAVAYVRGNNEIKTDLEFVRVEPYVRPKTSLTGDSIERVDTRVLQIIYKFDPTDLPIYAGQQMDIYIEDLTPDKK